MKNLFPDEVILTTDNFIIAQDWEVPIAGFFILSTKRQVRSIAEFTDQEAAEFGPLIKQVRRAMSDVLHIKDVYLFQNEDSVHGFHLWLFPCHEWMKDFGTKIESVRPIMQHAQSMELTDTRDIEFAKTRQGSIIIPEDLPSGSKVSKKRFLILGNYLTRGRLSQVILRRYKSDKAKISKEIIQSRGENSLPSETEMFILYNYFLGEELASCWVEDFSFLSVGTREYEAAASSSGEEHHSYSPIYDEDNFSSDDSDYSGGDFGGGDN